MALIVKTELYRLIGTELRTIPPLLRFFSIHHSNRELDSYFYGNTPSIWLESIWVSGTQMVCYMGAREIILIRTFLFETVHDQFTTNGQLNEPIDPPAQLV